MHQAAGFYNSHVLNKCNRNRREGTGCYHEKEDDSDSILTRSPVYASFNIKNNFSGRKNSSSFQSVRLSITDLQQREQKQTENSVEEKMAENLKVKSVSLSNSVTDINVFYNSYYDRMHRPSCDDPFEDIGNFSVDECQSNENICNNNEIQFQNIESERRNHKMGMQTMLTTSGLSKQAAGTSANNRIIFGVRMEYMTLSNKLKVNVKRMGTELNEDTDRKLKNLVAKISMLPGNIQKQQIEICNGDGSSLDERSLYFRDITSEDLEHKEIGVGIYKREGFFRRLKVIYEWKISMKQVDLKEPVMVWREMDSQI